MTTGTSIPAAMFCTKCGAPITPGMAFCGACAFPVAGQPAQTTPMVCPRCGAPATPGMAFCGACASPLYSPQQARKGISRGKATAMSFIGAVLCAAFAVCVGFGIWNAKGYSDDVGLLDLYLEAYYETISDPELESDPELDAERERYSDRVRNYDQGAQGHQAAMIILFPASVPLLAAGLTLFIIGVKNAKKSKRLRNNANRRNT